MTVLVPSTLTVRKVNVLAYSCTYLQLHTQHNENLGHKGMTPSVTGARKGQARPKNPVSQNDQSPQAA